MKKYIYTYQTKNNINGKTYIGFHSTDDLNDGYIGCGVRSDSYAKSSIKKGLKSAFISAVVKYGYSNFSKEILCFHESVEKAKEEEIYLVDSKWVLNKNNYNIRLGGDGGKLSNLYKYKDDILNDFKNGKFKTHIANKYNISYVILANFLKDKSRDIQPVKDLPYLSKYKDVIPVIINKRKTIPMYSISNIVKEYNMDFKTAKKIISGINIVEKEKIEQTKKQTVFPNKYLGESLYLYEDKFSINRSVSDFCKENNIKESNLRMLLCGKAKSANGFTLEKVTPVKLLKEGNIVEIKQDLKSFAEDRGIPIISLRYLIEKRIKQTKGYTLYNGRENN